MFFQEIGDLQEEFLKLYRSLFKHSEHCIKIVEALGKKAKGLTRDEIVALSKLSDGGTLTKMLQELELCGFIRRYKEFEKKNKYQLYQLIDAYTLFYLHFIRNNKRNEYWGNIQSEATMEDLFS
jgi:predicted transcriptional regulator